MKNSEIKVLLAEDDKNLGTILKAYLEAKGFPTTLCINGKEAFDMYNRKKFDFCILDVMMPVKDGFTVAEEIRKTDKEIPILFLTAKSLKEDRVKGFQTGCDDYITKPFSTEELSLRIEAILRRCLAQPSGEAAEETNLYTMGSYTFDATNMLLILDGEQRTLTRKETALLRILAKNKNKLVTREFILNEVWGTDDYFLGRSMDVFIAKLRKYLKEDPALSITNVHGAGFKLEAAESN